MSDHRNNSNNKSTQKMECRTTKNNDKSKLSEAGTSKNSDNESKNINNNCAVGDDANFVKPQRNYKRPVSPDVDDSLSDFKLPKISSKPYLTDNKIKLVNNKSSSSTSSSSSRGRKKRIKKNPDPTPVQSSFFKPSVNFPCPLCLKTFNDLDTQTAHTKNCATINNVSPKKLLAAAELQERQAEERLAIGLPAAPLQQQRKKSINIKKMIPEGDPDIHLAIALSNSLRDIEERENFDAALALAGETNENIFQMSSSQRRSTLQNFGFVTSKPAVEPVVEKRRKKHFGPTVLQTRTQETRERLLSDRIAEILIGNESITQRQLAENNSNANIIIETVSLCSDMLKKMHEKNSKLWNQSANKKKCSAYYVENLCDFISPVVSEEQLKNSDDEIETINDRESPTKMEIDEEPTNNNDDTEELKLQSIVDESVADVNKNNSLASSWRKMINSNAYSDVIIHVKNNRYIYSHEIVLWTRCQNIQQDFLLNENSNCQQKKKIHWFDIDFSSAIVFLEFIYCGEINLERIENENLIEVHKLAEKYKIDELINCLSEKINEVKVNEDNKSISEDDKFISEDIETISPLEIHVSDCNDEINLCSPKSLMDRSESKKIPEENSSQLSYESPNISHQLQYSCFSASPDMFEDMEINNSFICTVNKINNSPTNQNSNESETLDVSKLINENEPSNICEKEINSNEKSFETPKRSLRHSLTCPETSKTSNVSKNENLKLSSVKKTKSNMSLFIEKIKRQNERRISESDSESDISIDNLEKYRRNPFKIRNSNEDSTLLDKYNREKKSINQATDKKSALSIFEDAIRARVGKNQDKFVAFQNKPGDPNDNDNDSIEEKNSDKEVEQNIFSNDESEHVDDSMYTKYKRTHRRNSIDKYRRILKSLMQETCNEDNFKDHEDLAEEKEENPEDKNENYPKNSKHEISAVNKIRLAELSAFDIYEAMSPSPLNSSMEDSVKTKSFSPSKTPIDLVELSDDENLNELSNKFTSAEKTLEIIEKKLENNSGKVNSYRQSNDELDFVNWSEEMSEINDWQPLTQSNNENSPEKNSQVSNNNKTIQKLLRLSINKEVPIDLTQSDDEDKLKTNESPMNQSDFIKKLKHSQVASTSLDLGINIENNSKPIVVSSSSETESISGDISSINNSKLNYEFENVDEYAVGYDLENNFSQYVIEGGADNFSIPSLDYNQLPNTSTAHIDSRYVTFRSKSSKLNSDKIIHTISSNSDEELPKIELKKPKRCSSVSPRKRRSSARFLATKSKSEGDFAPLITSDNLITPTEELFSYLNLSSDECEISLDVPPRENYDAMSTPELNERLSSYGLRNQVRHRAVQLLNYIYDQLYPLVPEDLLTSHRDKLSINRNIEFNDDGLDGKVDESDNESSDSVSNSSEIAEEILNLSVEDEEYSEKDVILVRECFRKLLDKDRALHNKILMYEPIPLETVHKTLENDGIKCSLQLLGDYLDDECISFYIEHPKKRQRQKKK